MVVVGTYMLLRLGASHTAADPHVPLQSTCIAANAALLRHSLALHPQLSARYKMSERAVEAALRTVECRATSLDANRPDDKDGSYGELSALLSIEDLDDALEATVGQSCVQQVRQPVMPAADAAAALPSLSSTTSSSHGSSGSNSSSSTSTSSDSSDGASSSSSSSEAKVLAETVEEEHSAVVMDAFAVLTAQERYVLQRIYLDPEWIQQQAMKKQQADWELHQQRLHQATDPKRLHALKCLQTCKQQYVSRQTTVPAALIAEELGMSRQNVAVIKDRAIRKLKVAVSSRLRLSGSRREATGQLPGM